MVVPDVHYFRGIVSEIVKLARGASDFGRIDFSRVCETAGTSTSHQLPRAFADGECAPQGMMNGEIPRQLSAAFHERLVRECGDDREKIIARAWLLAYGRPVTGREKKMTLQFLNDTDMKTWCHALFNSNEFVYLR